MQALLSRYATPLTTGLFLISLISGVALFLHVGTAYFREMHEILSLVLAVPFVLHVWKNWRAFAAYFRRPAMGIALGLSLAAAIGFAAPAFMADGGAVSPQAALFGMIENGRVSAVAGLLDMTPEALASRLADAGFNVASPDQTLADVATASGKGMREMLPLLAAAR